MAPPFVFTLCRRMGRFECGSQEQLSVRSVVGALRLVLR